MGNAAAYQQLRSLHGCTCVSCEDGICTPAHGKLTRFPISQPLLHRQSPSVGFKARRDSLAVSASTLVPHLPAYRVKIALPGTSAHGTRRLSPNSPATDWTDHSASDQQHSWTEACV